MGIAGNVRGSDREERNDMYWHIVKFLIIIIVTLPFYLLIRRPWKRKDKREWALGAFMLYMAGLLVLVLEGQYGDPAWMIRSATERIAAWEGISLEPFRTICTNFRHFIPDVFAVNIIGNIVMFVPWGFGLPYLWEGMRSLTALVSAFLVLPLCIEICQLFIGRSVDIDDLILNFLGSSLGAGAFYGLWRLPWGRERLANKKPSNH